MRQLRVALQNHKWLLQKIDGNRGVENCSFVVAHLCWHHFRPCCVLDMELFFKQNFVKKGICYRCWYFWPCLNWDWQTLFKLASGKDESLAARLSGGFSRCELQELYAFMKWKLDSWLKPAKKHKLWCKHGEVDGDAWQHAQYSRARDNQ